VALLMATMVSSTMAQSAGSASSELVVLIVGSKQYHQPSCPLVARPGVQVRVMKLAEAKRRGLTAHDCGTQPGATAADPNRIKVYSQPGDNKYHTSTCPKLGERRTSLTLEEAGRKLWPCPVCKPPIRQRTATDGFQVPYERTSARNSCVLQQPAAPKSQARYVERSTDESQNASGAWSDNALSG
jgi:hypothetical protein